MPHTYEGLGISHKFVFGKKLKMSLVIFNEKLHQLNPKLVMYWGFLLLVFQMSISSPSKRQLNKFWFEYTFHISSLKSEQKEPRKWNKPQLGVPKWGATKRRQALIYFQDTVYIFGHTPLRTLSISGLKSRVLKLQGIS